MWCCVLLIISYYLFLLRFLVGFFPLFHFFCYLCTSHFQIEFFNSHLKLAWFRVNFFSKTDRSSRFLLSISGFLTSFLQHLLSNPSQAVGWAVCVWWLLLGGRTTRPTLSERTDQLRFPVSVHSAKTARHFSHHFPLITNGKRRQLHFFIFPGISKHQHQSQEGQVKFPQTPLATHRVCRDFFTEQQQQALRFRGRRMKSALFTTLRTGSESRDGQRCPEPCDWTRFLARNPTDDRRSRIALEKKSLYFGRRRHDGWHRGCQRCRERLSAQAGTLSKVTWRRSVSERVCRFWFVGLQCGFASLNLFYLNSNFI